METPIEGVYEIILRVRDGRPEDNTERDIEFHFPVRDPDRASAVVTQRIQDYDDIPMGRFKVVPTSTLESLKLEVDITKGDIMPGMETAGPRLMWYYVQPVGANA